MFRPTPILFQQIPDQTESSRNALHAYPKEGRPECTSGC